MEQVSVRSRTFELVAKLYCFRVGDILDSHGHQLYVIPLLFVIHFLID